MASPCEVLMDTNDGLLANRLLNLAANEAWRVEQVFSRYRDDNIVRAINTSAGERVRVDNETAQLLDFAQQCYELSEGMFDVTSGVLRQVWKFDGSDRIPTSAQVNALLRKIGWNKVRWRRPYIALQKGMEIDFGGIGKEYAVDRTVLLLSQECPTSVLVNFGGDVAISRPRRSGLPWTVGIEDPSGKHKSSGALKLHTGALATSGDARRFLFKNGKRYSHVLDSRTGWPVEDAPRSVTVTANTCTEAGILATLALLQGKCAEAFLKTQDVRSWCIR